MQSLGSGSRFWTFQEATKTLPYVRVLLGSLREHYIAARHAWWLNGRAPEASPYGGVQYHRNEGLTLLNEFWDLGVIPFQPWFRGIGMCPFEVNTQLDPGITQLRVAYFVYRDSRD